MNFNLQCFVMCLTIGVTLGIEELIECNTKAREKMDQLAMELSTFGDPNGKYPTSQSQLEIYCKNDRERIQWFKRYIEKCLNGLAYDVTSMAIKDMESVTKKYCDSPRLNKLFISWSTCGNSAINETVKCWKQYILDQERINLGKDGIVNKDRAALICCTYHRFDHCIEESFLRMGEVLCPTATSSGLHSILTEISGRLIESFCGDYQADNDKCDSIHSKYQYLNDIQLKAPLDKSPIESFIKIIESWPEFVDFFKSDNKTTEPSIIF